MITGAEPPRLSLGITGHREGNAAFAANRAAVAQALDRLLDEIDAILAQEPTAPAPTRMHSLLTNGVDQIAASQALAHGWELVAPLPYGRTLNRAISAAPATPEDALALLAGSCAQDPAVNTRAEEILALEERAHLFELADQDERVTSLFLARLNAPDDHAAMLAFDAHNSDQVALAGRVMVEQCDLVIGVWDGVAHNLEGGTGHTITTALALGTPVLLIHPARPESWSIITTPEALAHHGVPRESDHARLAALVRGALRPLDEDGGLADPASNPLAAERWPGRSSRIWLAYRLIEMLFGEGRFRPRALMQTYEPPERIAEGSGAEMLAAARALPGAEPRMVDRIAASILPEFARADGIASRIADTYRSGMVANFVLSAAAVLLGLVYQPLGLEENKWPFALGEFLLLGLILLITWLGNRQGWHQRWFDARRIAEYLRPAPALLPLGIARPPARWPRGTTLAWPEYQARHRIRAIGLPRAVVTRGYLRAALQGLLVPHVANQHDYHRAKARRLTAVHHRLDRLAEALFIAAVISVSSYLALKGLAALGLIDHELPHRLSKLATFLGVAFPTLAASISAIRFFGDFERFAGISIVAAEKLEAVGERLNLLLTGPEDAIDYAAAADLGRAIDEITVSEIEGWQAVFGGKHITLPA